MLCVEFPRVLYIDLTEIVQVVKAVDIVTCASLDLWTLFESVFLFFVQKSAQRLCEPHFSGTKFCVPRMEMSFE